MGEAEQVEDPKLELAKARARANLFFVLYIQAQHDLALAREEFGRERHKLELAHDEARQRLDVMLGSASWRATKPLRAVFDWIKQRL
jgi:hypothetical protein